MIKLSDLTAIEILDSVVVDINIPENRLYSYEVVENGLTYKQLLFDDSYHLPQVTRKHTLSSNMNNVLLGTSNFYPEQGLNIPDFYENSELHIVLDDPTLPLVQMKRAKLYFGQGLLSDPEIVGHWLRCYVVLEDSSVVTLCSVVDFKNDSNILATPAKEFENQIFNEALEIEFLDIDYILHSSNMEVFRDKLFNNSKPKSYYFEYSAFKSDSVDDFTENGFLFTSLNFEIINSQSLLIDIGGDELFTSLTDNTYYLTSRLMSQQYDTQSYLDTLKGENEIYQISHEYQILEYDSDNTLINNQIINLENKINKYGVINYSPVLNINTDHCEVNLTIRVKNINTSMIIRRDTSIILTNTQVAYFKPQASLSLNINEYKVNSVIHKEVNKIVQSNEIPNVLEIEKLSYVVSQSLNSLELLPADFTAKLGVDGDLTGYRQVFLRIGDLTFSNSIEGELVFDISEKAYLTNKKKYVLLDENQKTIGVGDLTYA